MYKKILNFLVVCTVIAPSITFAGSQMIFESSTGDTNAAGGGTVNLNGYGVSSVTVQLDASAYGASQVGGNQGYAGFAETNIGPFTQTNDVPNGTDPMSVSANDSRVFTKNSSGNWSSGGTGVSPAPMVSATAWVSGVDAIGYASVSGWAYWIDPTTGTINVTSNNPSASWTITGPATYTGSGSSRTYTNAPTGNYTITWGSVSGYTKPSTNSFTLTSGATINNSTYGYYQPVGMCRTGEVQQCGDWGSDPACETGGVNLVNNGGGIYAVQSISSVCSCAGGQVDYLQDYSIVPMCTPAVDINFL